jgi:TPR repeat protein
MKYWAGSVCGALAVASLLAGCAELGNGSNGGLPQDAHYKPTAEEVKRDPCKYNDVQACIALCQKSDARACNMVGVMFEFDVQGNNDAALASGFYRRACDATYAPGCNNLAWLYLGGRGVPQDRQQAMRLFYFAYDAARLACMRGEASGCLMAGELLFDGRVPGDDPEQAQAYFERACDAGEKVGCDRAKNNPY